MAKPHVQNERTNWALGMHIYRRAGDGKMKQMTLTALQTQDSIFDNFEPRWSQSEHATSQPHKLNLHERAGKKHFNFFKTTSGEEQAMRTRDFPLGRVSPWCSTERQPRGKVSHIGSRSHGATRRWRWFNVGRQTLDQSWTNALRGLSHRDLLSAFRGNAPVDLPVFASPWAWRSMGIVTDPEPTRKRLEAVEALLARTPAAPDPALG